MLPISLPATRSIAGVADDLFAALHGGSEALPAARSVVLLVVDGLGSIALRAHAGHARTLAGAMAKKDVAASVFPTTTAAALTSILTGVAPGRHGLVGYAVRDPAGGTVINQLSGWEGSGADPREWQSAPTIFERAQADGRAAFAVGLPEYASSGFSVATLRGARFVGEKDAGTRVAVAYQLAADNPGAVVYCYLPEVDKAGHKHGVASDQWIRALEEVDAAVRRAAPAGVGVLVTADHGMIDVPAHRQIVIEPGDARFDGVAAIAGEPRMLHVHLEGDADAAAVRQRWSSSLDGAAFVVSRAETVDGGLFGETVAPEIAARIGDLLVIARGNRALYDGRGDLRAQRMVGQHGALTPEETQVPLIRLGAFAR